MRIQMMVTLTLLLLFMIIHALAADPDSWEARYRDAVEKREWSAIRSLLKEKPEALMRNEPDESLLYEAIEKNDRELAVVLLEAGHGKTWLRDMDYGTYLQTAMYKERFDVAKAIISFYEIDSDIFQAAISSDNLEMVQLCIDKGFDASASMTIAPRAGFPICRTYPFLYALEWKHFKVAMYLTAYVDDVNLFDSLNMQYIPMAYDMHRTALDHAMKHDNAACIAWLKKRKAKTFNECLDKMSIAEMEKAFSWFRKTAARPTCDGLRVRRRPGLDGAYLFSIHQRDTVYIACQDVREERIDGFEHPWLYIVTEDGRRGWAYGGYLTSEVKMWW
ncbi:MAG TPA: hypothetical protein ENN69_00080 [Spirochaetia bacterium]|nr:hypothetical protein [Spirochaetia bacterium]